MNDTELRSCVLLTLQVALLGMVTPNMRSVLVTWTNITIKIRVVFDEAVSSDDIELVSQIESEVISHLPNHTVICQAEANLSFTEAAPLANEALVFQRASIFMNSRDAPKSKCNTS